MSFFPAVDDTIVAVSSGWSPSVVGVVRLSGGEAFALTARLGMSAPSGAFPAVTVGVVPFGGGELPARLTWFAGPRSYTGQDVVELHTVGCLPVLRGLADELIAAGARPAEPGEFTARGFLHGRLGADQVAGVLALLRAGDEQAVRAAGRGSATTERAQIASVVAELERLLALIEAGIDFVDEEDVAFISRSEVAGRLGQLLATVDGLLRVSRAGEREARPLVTLAGRPNAGKSTLFNALVGAERAIVSPVLGTTRDVISAEVTLGGVRCTLQDTAGLGDGVDELSEAMHRGARQAAAGADLVVWVHAADALWSDAERAALALVAVERRVVVESKCELRPDAGAPAVGDVAISVARQQGVDALAREIAARVRARAAETVGGPSLAPGLAGSRAALARALELTEGGGGGAGQREVASWVPELVALELRVAADGLGVVTPAARVERVLGQIFSDFCIGK